MTKRKELPGPEVLNQPWKGKSGLFRYLKFKPNAEQILTTNIQQNRDFKWMPLDLFNTRKCWDGDPKDPRLRSPASDAPIKSRPGVAEAPEGTRNTARGGDYRGRIRRFWVPGSTVVVGDLKCGARQQLSQPERGSV